MFDELQIRINTIQCRLESSVFESVLSFIHTLTQLGKDRKGKTVQNNIIPTLIRLF